MRMAETSSAGLRVRVDEMVDSPQFRVRADGIAVQELGDEVVVLDLRTSSYVLLNVTGAALWPALTEPSTIEQLARVLTARFDVDDERAAKAAAAFVEQLVGLGLIEQIGDRAARSPSA